jgi:OOP family OmpA-OmpF porin
VSKHISLGVAALLAVGWMGPVLAQDAEDNQGASPWYVGLGISRNDGTIPGNVVSGIGALAAPGGTTFTSTTVDDRFAGSKLFVGYRFFDFLALELGATRLGTARVNYNYLAGLTSIGTLEMAYSLKALYLDAVGMWSPTARWTLLGRVGLSVGQSTVKFDGNPITLVFASNEDQDDTKTRVKFGAGVQYNFTPAWGFRGEWERYKLPEPVVADELIKIDSFTGSVVYRF